MIIGIIPARYASTRFPGKPLALIHNKPMIQHVYERCKEADLDDVFVATDDDRIRSCVENFGGKVVMTHSQHLSGTDRCAEAARILKLNDKDFVINIQGDEPFIRKDEIHLLTSLLNHRNTQIVTLVKPITTNRDESSNFNQVKVVFTRSKKALYFSRSPIPCCFFPNLQTPRHELQSAHPSLCSTHLSYKHIGIYGYCNKILQQITKLPESGLEKIEKLEQLRWLENDFTIHVQICYHESIAVDTPEDLKQLNHKQ